MTVKLSTAQRRAVRKLEKSDEWQSAYQLQESMATLNALVKKGLAKSRGHRELGAFWSPQTTIKYKATYRS